MSRQLSPATLAIAKKLRRILGKETIDAYYLDLISILVGDDMWPLIQQFREEREKSNVHQDQ